MRFAIWGAGGIGCYYGARLQLAGHEVVYVARGEHLKALQTQGLTIAHENLQFSGGVTAVDQTTLLTQFTCEQFDLIIFAFKANSTAEVLAAAGDWLQAGRCPILSLQNGVENESLIAEVIGKERTLGGLAVRIGGHILKPGVIEAKGVAQVILGNWPQQSPDLEVQAFTQALVAAFIEAKIDCTLSDDIQKALWKKLIINNGVNPLSALTGLDTRALTSDTVYGRYVYKMMEETAVAGRNAGVEITTADVDEMFKLISEFDAIKTSMLVDREKGRPLELDGICGAVLRNAGAEQAEITELVNRLLSDQQG